MSDRRQGLRIGSWLLGTCLALASCGEEVRVVSYAGGESWSEIRFEDGVPQGEWKTWYESGQLESLQTYVDGVRNGPIRRWHENGRQLLEGTYLHGQKHGAWTSWYSNGTIERRREFRAGVPEGYWFQNHRNGVLRTACTYEHGEARGQSLLQSADGVKIREGFVESDGSERWTKWYAWGGRECEIGMRDGTLDGPCSFWGEDGELDAARSGLYAAGKRVGDLPAP